ncbi:hypothetical protein K7432_007046 [Basidiobolus ranarum]|uniref:ATP-grasp enzyme n=1 Tax=Basidiobolus ranarum TaxID=34480 RepID=A0ABR2W0P7_9FUNG
MWSKIREKGFGFFQNLFLFILLEVFLLPYDFFILTLCYSLKWLYPKETERATSTREKTIAITGGKMTKALQLCRGFKAAGHRVILIEGEKYWLSGARFSNSVDAFYTVPSPEKDQQGFTSALVDIIRKERVDTFIPVSSPASAQHESLAKPFLEKYCEVFHFDYETCKMLDDKMLFNEKARSIGLSVPQSFLITDRQQVLDFNFNSEDSKGRQYILKSIKYDAEARLNLTKLPLAKEENLLAFLSKLRISKDNPWILQEYIEGREYCAHATARDGSLRVYVCCESSSWLLNYTAVDKPAIFDWVNKFVKESKLTGQACFDFIEAENGQIYSIECNPRLHSAITCFYNHSLLADAYLSKQNEGSDGEPPKWPIVPLSNARPTYWVYHEMYNLLQTRSLSDLQKWTLQLLEGRDAVLSVNDPLPFFALYHIQIPSLLLMNLLKFKPWIRIDFNIGKLVEAEGD